MVAELENKNECLKKKLVLLDDHAAALINLLKAKSSKEPVI